MSIQRRHLLAWTTRMAAVATGLSKATAQQGPTMASPQTQMPQAFRRKMVGFMLAHEQFPAPELLRIGAAAAGAGFHLLATSDHLQPWQANEGHCGEAWVTLGALGGRVTNSWMGTTVTCPILRYHPAVVAEAFATLGLLYPGRVFLGVGSGEALNEQAATGQWPKWQERWDRLIEAITIIRQLWTGQHVSYKGTYYTVEARLYDPPASPIPLMTAANGKKSMRLAGQHGDGLVTDPRTWKRHKAEWKAGARDAGKDPAQMPVLVEQFVAVGEQSQAQQAAELWRFIPKHRGPGADPAARRGGNPAGADHPGVADRDRSAGARGQSPRAVRQRRQYRQHPCGADGSATRDRILRPGGVAEARTARIAGKKKAAPGGAAKFREETSKKADSAVRDRIAAMHNMADRSFAGKRDSALQHQILWTAVILTGSKGPG